MNMKKQSIGILLGFGLILSTAIGLNSGNNFSKTKADETPIVTLSFPDENSENNKVGSYTLTWTAIIGAYEWEITNFNNNNWNKWAFIKCGQKEKTTESSIKSSSFSDVVEKVVVTTTSSKNVTTASLFVGDDTDGISPDSTATGDWTFLIPEEQQQAEAEYIIKINVDNSATGTSNGPVVISSISYYGEAVISTDPNVSIVSDGDVDVGNTLAMSAEIQNAPESTPVTWSVDDATIATIDSETGLLTAVKSGSVTVTATITVDSIEYIGTKVITVNYIENVQTASLADIRAAENVQTVSYLTDVVIEKWGNKVDVSGTKDKYGNFVAVDDSGANAIVSYGSSFNNNALSFNKKTGQYAWATQYDFLENVRSNKLEIGDRIHIKCIRKDYVDKNGNTTIQISSLILSTSNSLILDKFVNDFMHPEISYSDNSSTGACLGEEGYYAKAKEAFNALTTLQREEFLTSENYSEAVTRLVAWATANGEALNGDNTLATNIHVNSLTNDDSCIIVVALVGILLVISFSGVVYFRKRHN